jgi:phosphosulfolactate synthase
MGGGGPPGIATERAHSNQGEGKVVIVMPNARGGPGVAGPQLSSSDYLRRLGVRELAPATTPFDPGYDPATVESHLRQSAHLMSSLKLSMASWLVADEEATRAKTAAARQFGVPTASGGGPFEIAVAQGQLPAYLDLCADIGLSLVECGEGFTQLGIAPAEVVRMAAERGLGVQFELGWKHSGSFRPDEVDRLVEQGRAWLEAGAVRLVIEARESATGIGLFDEHGVFASELGDRFARAFGLELLVFEAPTKRSQFALLDHYGPEVQLGNVRLEELLRVEIYRRGLHSDAFARPNLRPPPPAEPR